VQIPHIKFIDGKRLTVGNIYCIGRNYIDHAKELGNSVPTEPVVFLKSTSSLRGLKDKGQVAFPDESFHHEAEIVIVVKDVETKSQCTWDAVSHIGLGLDLTRRVVQTHLKDQGLPWTRAKSFLGSAIVSPFIPKSAFASLDDISFELTVNDELKQSGTSRDMIFSIPDLLAAIVELNPLREGDLVFTGTPAGVGPIQAGDRMMLNFSGTPYHFDGIL